MPQMRNALLTLLLMWLCCSSIAQAATAEAQLPRAYGYEIGDRFTQTVRVELAAAEQGALLDMQSLPKPGRQGAWVELAEPVQVQALSARLLQLTLHYQLMNTPREVALIFLPAHELKLIINSGNASSVKIEAQAISVSPITRDQVFTRTGMDIMQPASIIRSESTVSYRQYIHLSLLAALLFALLAAALAGWRHQQLQQRPFAKALRAARRAGDARQAMQLAHEAFNTTAGQAVFAQGVHAFIDARPQFAALRGEIEQFFAASRMQFFAAGDATAEALHQGPQQLHLLKLMQALARIEKRSAA